LSACISNSQTLTLENAEPLLDLIHPLNSGREDGET